MKKIIVAVLFISISMLLKAGGFQLNLQGEKQLSMGGCSTSLVLDPTITFYNPGGLAWLADEKVYLGGNLLMPRTTFKSSITNSIESTENQNFTPFSAFVSVGTAEENSKLTFGMGVYTPFGSGTRWPDGWLGRYDIREISLQTIFLQPTASYKVTDKLGVGAGFVYGFGNILLRQALPVADSTGTDNEAKLTGKGNGVGFNAGVYYEASDKLQVGVDFRSGVKFNLKSGDATFTVPSSLASEFPNTTFSSSIRLPFVTCLGVTYLPSEKLSVSAEWQFTGWNSYDTLSFDYTTNTTSLTDTKLMRLYHNSQTYRIGAQYAVNHFLNVRGGMYYDITPVNQNFQLNTLGYPTNPSPFMTPDLPDANRLGLTCGVGVRINSILSVDAALEYVTTKATEGMDYNSNFTGTYQTKAMVPGIAIQLFF